MIRFASLAILAFATVASAQFATTSVDVKKSPKDADWTPRPTRVLDGATTLPSVALDKYGGRVDERYDATGFFRTHKRDDGRWTLVDPDGGAFLSIGMNAVTPNPTPRGKAALKEQFGNAGGWARSTEKLLREIGFNTLACWSDYDGFSKAGAAMPYATQLNFMSSYGRVRGGTYQKPGHTGYPNDCIFVFDDAFEPFAMKLAQEKVGPLRGDPYLLGHFSDNELPFWKGMLPRYLKLPDGDAGKVAAQKWWDARRGAETREPTDADDDAFMEFAADRYYGIVARALKAADPNHLFLGSRLLMTSAKKDAILRGCAKHVDVLSVNYYGGWQPAPETVEPWGRIVGKPYVVTEWYAKGVDSGMGNTGGAGWLVKTQADRGAFYQHFTLGLLTDPNCVGWHWFKYIDNDADNTAADPSNRDSNKGIVTNLYAKYEPLIARMTTLNRAAYALRDQAATRPTR